MAEHTQRAKKILHETGVGEDRLSIVSEDEDFALFKERLDTIGINPLRTGRKAGP
jgi:hypothetical protein